VQFAYRHKSPTLFIAVAGRDWFALFLHVSLIENARDALCYFVRVEIADARVASGKFEPIKSRSDKLGV